MNREERRQLERTIRKNQKRGYKMKVYDITDKLKFDNSPKLKIKDIEVAVNSDAVSVIRAVSLLENSEENIEGIVTAYELMFSESDRKKIDKMKLQAEDFMTVVKGAVALASGQNPDEAEGNE